MSDLVTITLLSVVPFLCVGVLIYIYKNSKNPNKLKRENLKIE